MNKDINIKKYTIDLLIPKKYFNILILTFLILTLSSSVGSFFYFKYRDVYSYNEMKREDAINKLQETYNNFKSMTGKEFHNLWNENFHEAVYSLGGNGDGNKWDCSNSACYILKLLGANIPYSSTKDLMKILTEKSWYRARVNDCRLFDIILFNKDSAGIGHMGIIERIDLDSPKQLKYCDMNATSGAGYQSIQFGSSRIYAVYPITMEIWFGDLLKRE